MPFGIVPINLINYFLVEFYAAEFLALVLVLCIGFKEFSDKFRTFCKVFFPFFILLTVIKLSFPLTQYVQVLISARQFPVYRCKYQA